VRYTLISTVGSCILATGVGITMLTVVRSVTHGEGSPNPWKVNTLE